MIENPDATGTALTSPAPDDGFAMITVITIVMIMFIMLAAMLMPITLDVNSSIRGPVRTSSRQLGESVLNELFTRSAKTSDLSDGFRMIGRVNPGNNVDWAGPLAGWVEYRTTRPGSTRRVRTSRTVASTTHRNW